MGLIRKTLSISTLGLVNWKSKKEKLAEANAELELIRSDLEQATEKHSLLRDRVLEAEKRAQESELAALRDARRARRGGRRETRARVGRRNLAAATLREKVNPLVDSTRETTQRFAKDLEPSVNNALDGAKKRGRKARADAEKRAKKLRKRTRKSAEQAADSVRAKADELTGS